MRYFVPLNSIITMIDASFGNWFAAAGRITAIVHRHLADEDPLLLSRDGQLSVDAALRRVREEHILAWLLYTTNVVRLLVD